MAQKWYEKVGVQSAIVNALIGVLPATLVAIAAILVQVRLANQQIALSNQAAKDQVKKDKVDAIRTTNRYRSDSLLAVKELQLNNLQLELAKLKRKDDIDNNTRQNRLNKIELSISKSQLRIQNQTKAEKEINDLLTLCNAVDDLTDLMAESDGGIEDFRGNNSWASKVSDLMGSQLLNPALRKDFLLYRDWLKALDAIRSYYFFYGIAQKNVPTDSLNVDRNRIFNTVKLLSSIATRGSRFCREEADQRIVEQFFDTK